METSIYAQLADRDSLEKTMKALEGNGIHPFLVSTKEEARKKVQDLIPKHAEVMTMVSETLRETGIVELINESGDYISIRNMLSKDDVNVATQKRLGAAHEWSIGSVHAVTEDGHILIASATGSQLPAYAYGAANVIWVVGAQKIVRDLEDGMERIHAYVFPLENDRAFRVYGMGSGVNKVLIVNKELEPGRIHIIFVEEKLWF